MQRRPSTLLAATAIGMSLVLVLAGCEAQLPGTVPSPAGPQLTVVAPQGFAAPLPQAPPTGAAAALNDLSARIQQATADAADAGAAIATAVLDRNTDQTYSNGDNTPLPIASVAKLFIADDLLLQEAKGQTQLSPADRSGIATMLRSSDDGAAETFWNRRGGDAIVTRVTARYGLTSTTTPYDGHWWNIMSTTADLLRYYDMLLDGTGGLPPEQADVILSNLEQSTPNGIDGYPQRFGIPDGLASDQVAVKQGWMCCWNGGNWMHLSTGVIGTDRRYVMVVGSLQPTDDATARKTVTQFVKTVFPTGRI